MLAHCCLSLVILLVGPNAPKAPTIEEIGAGMDKRAAHYRNLRIRISVESQFRPEAPGGKPLRSSTTRAPYRATDTWLLASPDRSRHNSWMWHWKRVVEAEGKNPLFEVAWDGGEQREFYRNDTEGEPNVGMLTPFSNGDGMATNPLQGAMFFGYVPHDVRANTRRSTLDFLATRDFVVVGRDTVLGQEVYLIEGSAYTPEVKKRLPKADLPIFRYSITGAPHYLLLRADGRHRDMLSSTVEISRYGDYEDFKYPQVGEVHHFFKDKSGKETREDYRFEVTSLEIDRELTEQDFTFEWPSHTAVSDHINNRAFMVAAQPGDVTQKDVEARMFRVAKSPELRRSTPARNWLLWFNLGALMVLGGLLTWRWRRLRARRQAD